tara:strand:+ start:469 stop:660 length:192 start_codon:yes stop_codon:yes gene_type:complete
MRQKNEQEQSNLIKTNSSCLKHYLQLYSYINLNQIKELKGFFFDKKILFIIYFIFDPKHKKII